MCHFRSPEQKRNYSMSSPFHCVPLLNLIINYYSTSIKQAIKTASISQHFRRNVQNYCDETWLRLTSNAEENQTSLSSQRGLTIQRQLIDCCRRINFSWIVRCLLRLRVGSVIDVNFGVENYAVNYGDNPTPLIAACLSSNLEAVTILLSSKHSRSFCRDDDNDDDDDDYDKNLYHSS